MVSVVTQEQQPPEKETIVIETRWDNPEIPIDLKRTFLSVSSMTFHPDMLTPQGYVKEYTKINGYLYLITFDENYISQRLDKILADLCFQSEQELQEFFTRYSQGFVERTTYGKYESFIKNNPHFAHLSFEGWQKLQNVMESLELSA